MHPAAVQEHAGDEGERRWNDEKLRVKLAAADQNRRDGSEAVGRRRRGFVQGKLPQEDGAAYGDQGDRHILETDLP